MNDRLHRVQVALLAQVNQWRFQAETVTGRDVVTETSLEERAQVLRECAYELERFAEKLGTQGGPDD